MRSVGRGFSDDAVGAAVALLVPRWRLPERVAARALLEVARELDDHLNDLAALVVLSGGSRGATRTLVTEHAEHVKAAASS